MIPSLQVLSVNPRDVFRRQTHGTSQSQMIEIQKREAGAALNEAVNALIAFDETLVERSGVDRVRDDDHTKFELMFTPYITELIYHHRTPDERRTHHKALRGTLVIRPTAAMEHFMNTASRAEFRNKLGTMCTTVLSEAFSCLGLFGTKMIPLLLKEPDGTITLVDTANEVTNEHWPNAALFYQHIYDHSVSNRGVLPNLVNFDELVAKGMLFPSLAGKRPSFEMVERQGDHSLPPLEFLTSVRYKLN